MESTRRSASGVRAMVLGLCVLAGGAGRTLADEAAHEATAAPNKSSRIAVQPGASCEVVRPECSLEAALEALAPGGTLVLAAGRYPAHLRLRRDVTIEGAGPGQTILDAAGLGRVIRVDAGVTATLSGVTVTGGRLEKELERDGGGIWNLGTLRLERCEVAGNTAVDDGGGIRNDGALTVTDSTVRDNRAPRWGGVGGGIYNPIIVTDPTLLIVRSTISGNHAGANGGGIWCEHEVTVIASTVSGNSAKMTGGGIRNNGNLRLRDSTIAGNDAGTEGGGLRNFGVVEMSGTLIAGNRAAAGGPDCQGPVRSQGHNLLQDTARCELAPGGDAAGTGDRLGVDAGILPLGDRGGATWTHALAPGSPAIDAGGSGCETSDQRGRPRPAGGACDIGAFEAGLP